jgi:hypothetical protein
VLKSLEIKRFMARVTLSSETDDALGALDTITPAKQQKPSMQPGKQSQLPSAFKPLNSLSWQPVSPCEAGIMP